MRTFLHVCNGCAMAVETIDLVDEPRRLFLHVRGLPLTYQAIAASANLNREPLWRKLPTICCACAPSC